MRYGLVRVRENAESIAFYGGQANEMMALKEVSRCVAAAPQLLMLPPPQLLMLLLRAQ